MRLSTLPLALLLLLPVEETQAAFSTTRLHKAAVQRSKSLASNIRLAFRSILIEQPAPSAPRRQVYCSLRKSDEPVGSGHLPVGNSTNTTPANNPANPAGSSVPSASGSRTGSAGPKATPSAPSGGNHSPKSPWKLEETHAGHSFFDYYDFFTLPDPTHGNVDYVDEATGRANNLISVNDRGNVIMAMETTEQVANNRKSIRVTTKNTYSINTLLILNSWHVPTGCAVWPAWWSNGPNWPEGGEIDIFEPINDYTHNQAALHTAVGCQMKSTSSAELGIAGSPLFSTDCAANTTGNTGCGVRFDSDKSAGRPFNDNGGGVYAMKWDSSGVTIWFFPRGQIPADIDSENPLPDTWGPPQAHWEASTCDPTRFFFQHVGIINITACGDWAGSAWTSAGIPGQEQSCAERTGFATCQEFVRQRGSAFRDAYWEIEYVKRYSL